MEVAAKYHLLTERDYESHKAMVVPLVRILVHILFSASACVSVYFLFSWLSELLHSGCIQIQTTLQRVFQQVYYDLWYVIWYEMIYTRTQQNEATDRICYGQTDSDRLFFCFPGNCCSCCKCNITAWPQPRTLCKSYYCNMSFSFINIGYIDSHFSRNSLIHETSCLFTFCPY